MDEKSDHEQRGGSVMIYRTEKIDDSLYVITEVDSVHMYLIIGKDRAVLFDTAYGYGDVKAEIAKIADREVMPVLSHGHVDHGTGVFRFDEAWLNMKDMDLLKQQDSYEMKNKMLEYRLHKLPELENEIDQKEYYRGSIDHVVFHDLKESDLIDLGDRVLKVFDLPGHTYGSIGLFDEKYGRLFTGDPITKHNIWNQMTFPDFVPPLRTLMDTYKKAYAIQGLKEIYPAHNEFPCDRSLLLQLQEMIRDLLVNYKNDSEIETAIGRCFRHDYQGRQLLYTQELLNEALANGVEG